MTGRYSKPGQRDREVDVEQSKQGVVMLAFVKDARSSIYPAASPVEIFVYACSISTLKRNLSMGSDSSGVLDFNYEKLKM